MKITETQLRKLVREQVENTGSNTTMWAVYHPFHGYMRINTRGVAKVSRNLTVNFLYASQKAAEDALSNTKHRRGPTIFVMNVGQVSLDNAQVVPVEVTLTVGRQGNV